MRTLKMLTIIYLAFCWLFIMAFAEKVIWAVMTCGPTSLT
jgi:hypothetical protein